MSTDRLLLSIMFGGLLCSALPSAFAQALSMDDLTVSPPQCKMPKQKRPMLRANNSYDSASAIFVDATGDGWCDYILQVPYPITSKMSSYDLDELMLLGSPSGWKPPFHGKRIFDLAHPMGSLDNDIWPMHRVDFVDAKFVYHKRGAAPYVLGVFAGGEEARVAFGGGCQEYRPVYRWNDVIGGFKKVDKPERDAVLKFYYSKVMTPCKT